MVTMRYPRWARAADRYLADLMDAAQCTGQVAELNQDEDLITSVFDKIATIIDTDLGDASDAAKAGVLGILSIQMARVAAEQLKQEVGQDE